jgi:hypothetical protein
VCCKRLPSLGHGAGGILLAEGVPAPRQSSSVSVSQSHAARDASTCLVTKQNVPEPEDGGRHVGHKRASNQRLHCHIQCLAKDLALQLAQTSRLSKQSQPGVNDKLCTAAIACRRCPSD